MRNREFVFTPKIEYKLVAERSEANQNSLTFSFWCSILELVRTAFRRLRRRGSPPRKFGRRRSRTAQTAKEPVENIGSNHIFNFWGRKFLIQTIDLIIGFMLYFLMQGRGIERQHNLRKGDIMKNIEGGLLKHPKTCLKKLKAENP